MTFFFGTLSTGNTAALAAAATIDRDCDFSTISTISCGDSTAGFFLFFFFFFLTGGGLVIFLVGGGLVIFLVGGGGHFFFFPSLSSVLVSKLIKHFYFLFPTVIAVRLSVGGASPVRLEWVSHTRTYHARSRIFFSNPDDTTAHETSCFVVVVFVFVFGLRLIDELLHLPGLLAGLLARLLGIHHHSQRHRLFHLGGDAHVGTAAAAGIGSFDEGGLFHISNRGALVFPIKIVHRTEHQSARWAFSHPILAILDNLQVSWILLIKKFKKNK